MAPMANVLKASESFKNAGRKALNGNAASACIPNDYYGTASGTVVFPPGFSPRKSSGNVQSVTKFVPCTE